MLKHCPHIFSIGFAQVFTQGFEAAISINQKFHHHCFPHQHYSLPMFPVVSDLTIHCAVIFFPLYRSWALEKNYPESESVLHNGRESFVKLLETSKGFDAFFDFVTGEFSVGPLWNMYY